MCKKNYLREASDDACETIRNFADEILEQLLDSGKASDDLLNDYPNGDSWHHECHVDKWYSLTDAAELIDQLSDYEETDSGLWDGQQPKEAIGTCAAFTYGNAVYNEWHEHIEQINEEADAIIDDFDDKIRDAESALEEAEGLEEEATALEAEAEEPGEEAESILLEAADKRKEAAILRQQSTDESVLNEEKKEALRDLINKVADRP